MAETDTLLSNCEVVPLPSVQNGEEGNTRGRRGGSFLFTTTPLPEKTLTSFFQSAARRS
jgi:hypothetical protein